MPIDVVEQLKAELKDQPVNPMRPRQVAEFRSELAQLGVAAEGRDMDGQPREWLQSAKGAAVRRAKQITGMLNSQAPRRISGERANRVKRLGGEVLSTVIQPAMQPRSVMRRNPPGAVGQALRTEFHPEYKDAALTVKRAMLALDPDNQDPDFTNLERFRPEGGGPDGNSTFMAGAQISGVFAFGTKAAANWPFDEPTADTAIKQVRRREATEAAEAAEPVRDRAPRAAKPKKPKRTMSPAQQAALARGRANALAKRRGEVVEQAS